MAGAMKQLLAQLREGLNRTALASMAAAAAIALFSLFAVNPLEKRVQELDVALEQAAKRSVGMTPARFDGRIDALGTFYKFFDRRERPEDWLAKIYGTAKASGLEFRSAEYRAVGRKHRIERYEITLPINGTYSQIRTFLENALAEIPIMSLDQASYRRKSEKDSRVEAQV